jgi:hypothetical protein
MKRLLAWQLVWLVPSLFAFSLFFGWLDNRAIRASLSPAGGPDPFFSMWAPIFVDIALCLSSVLAFVVGLVLGSARRTQFAGIFVLLCALAYLGGGGSRHMIFGNPRKEAFTKLGERMMPLVRAIEAYHRDHGTYPESLDALVPAYLDKLPATGMGNYTNYNFYVGSRAQHFGGNPWIIEIPVGYGMNFDQFYYFPLQNYPDGWPYKRMGKWAYYDE